MVYTAYTLARLYILLGSFGILEMWRCRGGRRAMHRLNDPISAEEDEDEDEKDAEDKI